MSRRRIVVLVVAAALVALGTVAVVEAARSPPWLLWALVRSDGTILDVREGGSDGTPLGGEWSGGVAWQQGRPLGLREVAGGPAWFAWLRDRVDGRRASRWWFRVPRPGDSDSSPPPSASRAEWMSFVLEDPDPGAGDLDPRLVGMWELRESSFPDFEPQAGDTVTSDVRFAADGTVEHEGIRGWWRTRDGALAVHVHRQDLEWTSVFPVDAEPYAACRKNAFPIMGYTYTNLRRVR